MRRPRFLATTWNRKPRCPTPPPPRRRSSDAPTPVDIEDPLADALAEIRAASGKGAPPPSTGGTGVVDPLADVLAEIRAKGAQATAVEARAPTLPFGGDKWGRDVLKKTIKGSETSIFVGLAAAIVATFLGTVFGAVAGYYGKWIDDFFNWFFSVFTSMPYAAAHSGGRRGAAAKGHADDHTDSRA